MENLIFGFWQNAVIVFLGSGIGGVLRYFIFLMQRNFIKTSFPVGTIVVNLIGCMLIMLAFKHIPQSRQWLFLSSGVLGGFTTFSVFCLDIVRIQEPDRLVLYLVLTLLPIVFFKALFFKL